MAHETRKETGQDPAELPTARDFTRIGVFLFLGLLAGAVIGGFGFYSPAVGALIGAGTGLVLAVYLDWRARRNSKS